jgi:hypothetical protein
MVRLLQVRREENRTSEDRRADGFTGKFLLARPDAQALKYKKGYFEK